MAGECRGDSGLGRELRPAWADPLAMAYAGHQFGHFVPQLGDGRAILLGETLGRDGTRRDLVAERRGPDPFSRRGDGRLPSARAPRIYSQRGDACPGHSDDARAGGGRHGGAGRSRDRPARGRAHRVAASHLRIGTFEYCAARGDHEALTLVEYALARHYPALQGSPTPALALLGAVREAHAALVARWMQVGFIHGVMNTDNMTIAGETLDYGPCAFLDTYDPATVFSSIDHQAAMRSATSPASRTGISRALPRPSCPSWMTIREGHRAGCRHGWPVSCQLRARVAGGHAAEARARARATRRRRLIDALLALMHAHAADYTNTFRRLCAVAEGGAAPAGYEAWVTRWRTRLATRPTRQAAATLMRAHNPAVIPRNHRVEAVLDAAVHQGDFAPLEAFLAVLATPFALAPHQEAYSAPPAPSERVYQTFVAPDCGAALQSEAPPPTPPGRGAQGGLQCQHGAALWRMPVECPLLMGLAPWLLGLGIEVRHHRTFLACLAFTLIRLTAFGFHGCPSLPAAASPDQAPGGR